MKIGRVLLVLTLLAVLALSAAAWDSDDIEIFELQSALEDSEGKGTNFYSVLGLTRGASLTQIRKAYREKSLEWHPDKNPGLPNVHKRFERLGLIHSILRDERRDRYDHFLSNGFPKWRGTGYFYARFRPGLGMVLVLLVLASVGVQYAVKLLNFRRDQARIDRLYRSALAAAWGAWFQTPESQRPASRKGPPAEKKVRVPLTGYPDLPAAPSAKQISAGTVNWEEEGEKVRKAITQPATGPDASRLIEVFVYADGSIAALDPDSKEWIPVEPLRDADAPTLLKSTWPATLGRSLVQRSAPASEPAEPAEEPEPEKDAGATPKKGAAAGKTTPKRRKRGGKKN